MPPFIPKKRVASTPPPSLKSTPVKKQKLADVLDAEALNIPGFGRQQTFDLGSDDSDSSLSDVDSDQFQDVPPAGLALQKPNADSDDEDSDDDHDFEDIDIQHDELQVEQEQPAADPGNGALQLKFDVGVDIDYGSAARATKGKQGPSRREKEVRVRTHQLHVRYLLWHNSVRNRWICDRSVQQTLLSQLPAQIKKEVEKWRRASGLPEQDKASEPTPQKGKKSRRGKVINPRDERDWGRPSEKIDTGKADLSRGDPLMPLLRILAAYWKKRFAITAPGLRKRGYGTKLQLRREVESYRNDEHDAEKHGERIRNIKEFREIAKICEGSRDVGSQLFTALLRGLGIESRLVASLQPAGYGWTKLEQMVPRKQTTSAAKVSSPDSSGSEAEIALQKPRSTPKTKQMPKKSSVSSAKKRQPTRRGKGNKDAPIDLDSEASDSTSDKDSVVDITPSLPKQRAAKYDRDLVFPIYWTEAISPVTNQVIPVDPLVLEKPVASTPELLSAFEPRGAKAENARLLIAYVIAYSDDGTAKDVTVRYLRKHIWPGKTKSFRYPIEKVPIYDRTGRIKRYEDYDWFKHIMSGYVRTDAMRTAVDDVEESTDLVPQLPEKKNVDDSVDTLQSIKASADFVLERFLRREEALRPGANPVRTFVSGKGEKLKTEPVYRRSDVERCLTAESWHKEGRQPQRGEEPMKMVPVRAVTLTRKREAEEHERVTGSKQLQGLYSWDQTEYIIPPPIENGVIPKNSYGNIDCFVPSMVPRGAVHIPQRGTVRICKKLEIDYAEAVVGFEFGNKRAVPVINGVVVAKEHEKELRKAWKEWNDEQQKKDAVKQEKLVLDLWRKFVMGLRIRERVGEMYGEELGEGSTLPVHLKQGMSRKEPIDVDMDEDSSLTSTRPAAMEPEDDGMTGGGFLLSDEEDRSEPDELVIEHHHPVPTSGLKGKGKGKEKELDTSLSAAAQYPTPASMPSTNKPVSAVTMQGTRRQAPSAPVVDDEGESVSDFSELPDSRDRSGSADQDEEDSGDHNEEDSMNQGEEDGIKSVPKDSQLDGADSDTDTEAETDSTSLTTSHDNSDSVSSSEEDFIPPPSSRRRSKPTAPTSISNSAREPSDVHPSTPSTRTRSTHYTSPTDPTTTKSNIKVIIDTAHTHAATTTPVSSKTSIPNRSARGPHATSTSISTGVTSPYFKNRKNRPERKR